MVNKAVPVHPDLVLVADPAPALLQALVVLLAVARHEAVVAHHGVVLQVLEVVLHKVAAVVAHKVAAVVAHKAVLAHVAQVVLAAQAVLVLEVHPVH